jgi:hypothetical protein
MLRQDNPAVGRVPPPRALPMRYVLEWNVTRVRSKVGGFWKHDGIGWPLLSCVIAIGVGVLIGH